MRPADGPKWHVAPIDGQMASVAWRVRGATRATPMFALDGCAIVPRISVSAGCPFVPLFWIAVGKCTGATKGGWLTSTAAGIRGPRNKIWGDGADRH